MSQINSLKKLVSSIRGGPAPHFEVVHAIMAIRIIGDHPGIGRKELSRRLGLGEGSVRTLLSKLKSNDLVTITKEGCTLSANGIEIYNWLNEKISPIYEVDLREIWEHQFSVGIVVKNGERLVRRGIEQRDVAIKFGAAGAMTLILKSGKLLMPEITNLSDEFPEFASKLIDNFFLKEGDVLIIAGASNLYDASYGALAAALLTLGVFTNP